MNTFFKSTCELSIMLLTKWKSKSTSKGNTLVWKKLWEVSLWAGSIQQRDFTILWPEKKKINKLKQVVGHASSDSLPITKSLTAFAVIKEDFTFHPSLNIGSARNTDKTHTQKQKLVGYCPQATQMPSGRQCGYSNKVPRTLGTRLFDNFLANSLIILLFLINLLHNNYY